MKKTLLSITLLTFIVNFSHAQSKQDLQEKFKLEKERNEAFFNQQQTKKTKNYNKEEGENITTVATVIDGVIYHNKLTDIRANSTSNVEALQNGEINNFSLNGEGMEVTIFDGGGILSSHEEFRDLVTLGKNRTIDIENGAEPINFHATSVAGFIAAEGSSTLVLNNGEERTIIPNAAKGVLPKAIVNSAGFATVNGLNIFLKLLFYGKHISNHSYGTSVGWNLINDDTHSTNLGLKFNTAVTSFTSPDQTLYGAYHVLDRNYDLISYAFPTYTIVKAAGNENERGPNIYAKHNLNLYKYDGTKFMEGELIPNDNCQSGAYCISFGSLAKNIIVVGAIDLPNSFDNKVHSSSEIIRSNYSSAGPRKDGAIKPDLVAVGTRVISPSSDDDNSYRVGSGTSYSAPKVTGVVGAITQLKRLLTGDSEYYFNSDEVKAFLLHSTKEAGLFDGPDNKFGWGLLDAEKTAKTVLEAHNKEILFERNEKESSVNDEKIIYANGSEELKATITWIDPAGNFDSDASIIDLIEDTSSKLVNDLDLRIVDTETGEEFFPWRLDLADLNGPAVKGDNTVDNIEQIIIKNPIAGRKYKVVVSNKGDLVNDQGALSNQNYTLLVTGAKLETLSTENFIKSEVSVYPTLAKDVVHIKTVDKIQKVDLIDLTGKLISTTKTNQVNVSSLSAGVYIVNITTDKGVTTKKIVKQ